MNRLTTTKRLFSAGFGGRSVVIVGAKRTPIGSFMGKLKGIKATELGSYAIRGAIEHSGLSPEDIEEGFMGSVL
jgi:acetyl-CoA C-acetyltransferase